MPALVRGPDVLHEEVENVPSGSELAREIVSDLLGRSAGRVFWDIPQPNASAVALAESLGFKPVRDLTRMWSGSERIEPNLNLQYALSDPGTG